MNINGQKFCEQSYFKLINSFVVCIALFISVPYASAEKIVNNIALANNISQDMKNSDVKLAMTGKVKQWLAPREYKQIKIAGGPIISRYYLVATKLCYFFKQSNKHLKCDVIITNGTVARLETVTSQLAKLFKFVYKLQVGEP